MEAKRDGGAEHGEAAQGGSWTAARRRAAGGRRRCRRGGWAGRAATAARDDDAAGEAHVRCRATHVQIFVLQQSLLLLVHVKVPWSPVSSTCLWPWRWLAADLVGATQEGDTQLDIVVGKSCALYFLAVDSFRSSIEVS